ncbi:MAG: sulfatase-like hydrolase/transferase, partial [Acidobacteriota bacterium]
MTAKAGHRPLLPRRRFRRRGLAAALPVLWLAALTACSDGGSTRLAERLIADDPQHVLPRADLFDVETVFTWDFSTTADTERWSATADGSEITPGGWRLRPRDRAARIVHAAGWAADGVHRLELTGAAGHVDLLWAGPGEEFAEERTLRGEVRRTPGGGTWTFDVAGHPAWRGQIERVRLDLVGSTETVDIRTLVASKLSVRGDALATRLASSWKIDLGAEVRNAWLALPDIDVERTVTVGPGHELRVSYGLEAAVQEPVEFAILDGAGGEELWGETLSPTDADRWFEARVDLARFEGRSMELHFETRSRGLLDPARGFPVWANPEILEPAPESAPELPNVIFVSLDTLRSDRMSTYGHSAPTTPNIDRWAERSAVVFENAVAQAPWTLPSHASMLTGLEALRHDINHFGEAPVSLEMLAETLRDAGYSTAAITGGGYLRPQFGFAQGFDS